MIGVAVAEGEGRGMRGVTETRHTYVRETGVEGCGKYKGKESVGEGDVREVAVRAIGPHYGPLTSRQRISAAKHNYFFLSIFLPQIILSFSWLWLTI